MAPCVIGLVGGIASGKSLATKRFAALGIPVIDGDVIGHSVYTKGQPAFQQLVDTFGAEILSSDGSSIERKELGKKVFGNAVEMKKLTDIVWPQIEKKAVDEFARLGAEGHPIVVFEAAVLIEAGWQRIVSEIWLVEASIPVAKQRLMARNNLSDQDAQKRIDSQMSPEERRKYAREVIENNSSVEELNAHVDKAVAALRARLSSTAAAL